MNTLDLYIGMDSIKLDKHRAVRKHEPFLCKPIIGPINLSFMTKNKKVKK